ncbi:hypothetical protein AB0L00_27185 [Actinoallomurus sp. NPDC052308]|uniref:hypothetical protein n=1 Tax=Actinoallomurus sp. NPDC052308 TaxID=3155530 RepID=UPI00342D47DE
MTSASSAPSGWTGWLETLSEADRARALALRDRFAALGAEYPEEEARLEVGEDIPQLARFLLLRHIWEYAINSLERPGEIDGIAAARRLLDAGADRADVVTLARRAACDAAFAVLYALDVPNHDLDDDSLPAWSLRETTGDTEEPGRHMDDLHAELLSADPSGRQAEDLLF